MEKIIQKEGYVVWTINLSDTKKGEYLLPSNVKGTLFIDGAATDEILPGGKYKYKREKYASSTELALSVNDPITIKWGFGNVPYTDYEAKCDAKCGLSGEIQLMIFRTKEIFKKCGKELTDQDIKAKVIGEVSNSIEACYKDILEEDSFGRPDITGAKKERLITKIENKVNDQLALYGLNVTQITIFAMSVDEAYLAKRQEWEDRKREKKQVKEDLDVLIDIKETLKDDEPKVVIKEVVKCPGCGREVKQGERFCAVCGRRI